MSNVKVDSIKGHDPTFEIEMDTNANLNVNGSLSVSGFDSQIAIPKGTTGQRPSSPSAGMIRFNTTDDLFEVYNGSGWEQFGVATGSSSSLLKDFNLYDNSGFDAFISHMSSQKTTWAASGTNYQYETDASDDRINDAQSDMYDGGNYTQVRKNGSASGNIGYNSGRSTYSDIKYQGLGYSWPLVAIAVAPKDTTTTYGWSRSGNLGADNGGGTPNSITVYANASVAGFDKVNAWLVNKAWNQNSDPGVMHLYYSVSSSRWSGDITDGFATVDYASNSDNDYSQYQATVINGFVWTALVSNGQTVGTISASQAQTFVENFLTSAAAHLGF